MKTQKGSTKNLFNHLRKHHPAEYKQLRPDIQRCSSKGKVGQPSRSSQSTIQQMFTASTKYKRTDTQWLAITKDITIFLCETMTPISIVDKPSWLRLLKRLDRRYECPSRNHFTYNSIPSLYNELRELLQSEISESNAFSLTMDAWSSIKTEPFLVITVHFVNKEYSLISRVLQCVYMPEDHTGLNIAERVLEVLDEFHLPPSKIVSITTDAGTNMVSALQTLHLVRLTCFGHILHNAIGKAVKDQRITRVVGMCRRIVSIFSFSFKKSRTFKKVQQDLKLDDSKLKSDVATRWGSMFKMVKSVQDNQQAIQTFFSQGEFFYCIVVVIELN